MENVENRINNIQYHVNLAKQELQSLLGEAKMNKQEVPLLTNIHSQLNTLHTELEESKKRIPLLKKEILHG